MQIVDDDDDEKIKVVTNYKPRMAGQGGAGTNGSGSSGMMTIDPVTGKAVPLDQLEEHMRIQLLDPKWKEEQRRFQEKQKETGFAEGASIADNLKIFAQKRGDIFGQTVAGSGGDATASSIAEQEAKEQLKHQQASQVQWDGHLASMQAVQQMKSMMPGTEMVMPMSNIGPAPAPPTLSVPPPPPMFTGMGMQPPPPPSMPMAPQGFMPLPPQMPVPVPPSVPMGFPPMPPSVPKPPMMPTPAPPSEDDQKNKKPRIEESKIIILMNFLFLPFVHICFLVSLDLMSAEAFAALYPGPIELTINIPQDSSASNWNFNGQTIRIQIPVTMSVKDIKEMLGNEHLGNMPANKMQLKTVSHGFLKDASLAALNIGPGTQIELSAKSRGGKR
jgi:splicing factor 3A subunit 1